MTPTAVAARHRPLLHALLLALLGLWLWPTAPAQAEGFRVLRAASTTERGLLRLDAQIDFQFTEAPLEALRNGVPLTIEIDIEVVRDRDYL